MLKYNKCIGLLGENAACKYLKNSGYKIIHRNKKVFRGEIDIICMKNDYLVFVEVKTLRLRTSDSIIELDPLENITNAKQKVLIRNTQMFLSHEKMLSKECRIDAIGIVLTNDYHQAMLRHCKNIVTLDN